MATPQSQTYNITDIWKAIPNIGYTEYVNVADGTKRIVPWGHFDWIGVATSLFVFSGLVYFAVRFLAKF